MPLPFKGNIDQLGNNKSVATCRLNQLNIIFAKDAKHWSDNVEFMNSMGVAEPVPEQQIDEKKARYIPHHGVYHSPRKKMREGPKFLPSMDVYSQSGCSDDTSAAGSQAVGDDQKSHDCSSDEHVYFKSRNFSIAPDDPGVKKHVNVHAVVTEQCLDLSRFSRVYGCLNRFKAIRAHDLIAECFSFKQV